MDAIVVKYGMQPHPEGGFFVEWYGSSDIVSSDLDPARWPTGSSRRCATAILYMCKTGGKSALHRIRSDELWMWHSGDALTVVELLPASTSSEGVTSDTSVRRTILGPNLGEGQSFVHSVRGKTYFGAYCDAGSDESVGNGYSLVTCVVAPGFDYKDWEMASAEELRAMFPGTEAAAAIALLAHQ